MNHEERIAELESRVAFQEDSLDKLSEVIAKQDRALIEQEKMIKYLHEQLKKADLNSQISSENEPPPPHY